MELPRLPPGIAGEQRRGHVVRRLARPQARHAVDGIHRVDQRLRRERRDAALHMDGERADGEEARRDRRAERAGRGIARQDGPGHGRDLRPAPPPPQAPATQSSPALDRDGGAALRSPAEETPMREYRIAAIPADGIGPEVIDAGLEVLDALAARDGGFRLAVNRYDWGSERYRRTAR